MKLFDGEQLLYQDYDLNGEATIDLGQLEKEKSFRMDNLIVQAGQDLITQRKVTFGQPNPTDVIPPTVIWSLSTTKMTNKDVTVTIQANGEVGDVYSIKLPNGSYVYANKATFTAP